MNQYRLIKTNPDRDDYNLFSDMVHMLYTQDSQRFILGNDPVIENLEGCYVLSKNEKSVGRFAFYENKLLDYRSYKTAVFGSYECVNDLEIAKVLHIEIEKIACSKGYNYILGPMEGSTWQNYRFSDHNKLKNFFMEPYHHAYYGDQIVQNGMVPIAHYISNLDEDLVFDSEKLRRFEKHYKDKGAKFRFLDIENIEEDLHKIAIFCNDAFSDNFLYTPINPDDFVQKYIKLNQLFDPHLIWIVEDQSNEMQAFIFATKDYLDKDGKTTIIKSMARRPNTDFKGIGSYLAGKIIQLSDKLGYTKIIHALMMKDNTSIEISKKYKGKSFKSYTLYGKNL